MLKGGVKKLIAASVTAFGQGAVGRYVYGEVVRNAMSRTQRVAHRGTTLEFCVPNRVNKFRADTFAEKEPETLDWIDSIPRGSVVWDIGANVGLYACYAAKSRGCRVFAFEPSVFNLELLARNIFQNELTALVTIIPLPLSDELALSTLNMTSTEWGGALSTFGQSYGHDGKPMQKVFEFSTLGLSMKHAVEILRIPFPDYIKLDVDGIEHLILRGGETVLARAGGLLVEINESFPEQAARAEACLVAAGLQLREKRRWQWTDHSPFDATFNQIWERQRPARQ